MLYIIIITIQDGKSYLCQMELAVLLMWLNHSNFIFYFINVLNIGHYPLGFTTLFRIKNALKPVLLHNEVTCQRLERLDEILIQ